MKRRLPALAALVFLCLISLACIVPNWVSVAEGLAKTAVPIAASIVSIVEPTLAPLMNKIVDGFKALEATLDTFRNSPTETNRQAVVSFFNAVNANVSQLEGAAQIKNPNADQKVKAIVGLLTQAVSSIAAQIPPAQAAQLRAAGANLPIGKASYSMRAGDLKHNFNKIVEGDTRFTPIK